MHLSAWLHCAPCMARPLPRSHRDLGASPPPPPNFDDCGAGESIEEAIASAGWKALNENFAGRLFSRELIDRGEVVDLRSLLGLNIPKVTITRRL